MILIDTNILIEIYRSNDQVVNAVKAITQENTAVSDITSAELYYGARNKRELKLIQKDLKKLNVLHVTAEISKTAVELVRLYALSHKLSLPDALIAATSLVYDIPLYTLNKKDFSYLPNIKLYN